MQFANEGILEPDLLTPVQSCLLFTAPFFKKKKKTLNFKKIKMANKTVPWSCVNTTVMQL